MSNVLITGGSGFIGHHVVNLFLEEGYTVFATVTPGENVLPRHPKLTLLPRFMPRTKIEYLPPLTALVHLAAITDPQCLNEGRMNNVNKCQALALMRRCLKVGCPRIVYASSASVYGNNPAPFKETDELNPLTPYAKSKMRLENGCKNLPGTLGLRFSNVYGTGEAHKGANASMIGKIFNAVRSGESPKLFRDGTQQRDFVHVKDEKATWEDALAEAVKTSQARPDTIRGWGHGVDAIKQYVPEAKFPADLTPELAQRFGRLFLSGTYKRGKSGVERKRSPVTLSYYVRALSSLWRHFRELSHVKANPWGDVVIPKAEKKQKYVPTENDITLLFDYIYERFPKWERLHALLMLKLISACRTADIVQLKTEQIENGQLVFLASQTKTKADRAVPLPDDLFATLKRIGGKVHLWDGWNAEVLTYRPGCNPLPKEFVARTVLVVLNNIFREYSDSHPERPRLNPHDFRRRTITHMVKQTGSVDKAATALGITAQCAKAHYLDAQQAFDVKEAFSLTMPGLLPARTNPVLTPNNSEQSGTETSIRPK